MPSPQKSYFQLNVPFTSLKTLSLLISIYGIVAIAEICLVTLVMFIGNWALLNDNPAIFNWLDNPIVSWYDRNTSLFDLLFFAATIIFLVWFYQAYRNLYALDKETDNTPGAVIGECIVPLINLRGPYINMREIWQKVVNPTNWQTIKTWWGSLIVGSIAYYIALGMQSSDATALYRTQNVQLLSIATFFYMVSSLCFITFNILLLKIVHTISITETEQLMSLPTTRADHSHAILPGADVPAKAGMASKIMLGTIIAVIAMMALFIVALILGGLSGLR